MRMTLERMTLTNFKGIRDLTIDFGITTHISGANGTGKTTIPDAFCWVLYNKDSRGNAPGSDNFREKPVDANGQEIHNLETSVELRCLLDGKAFNLKRTQRENWVKKRGNAEASFQGNTSFYWINDVETALKDFKARISEIAPEEIIRLVGTLSAFNAQEWKKRREILLSLSGKDVDAEMLSTEEYSTLAAECEKRNIGIDDLRKVLADQRKRTASELQMIPIRIDEARKALPDISEQEIKDAEYIIKDNEAAIERLNGMIADARAADQTISTKAQIAAYNQEYVALTKAVTTEWQAGRREPEHEYNKATDDMSLAEAQVKSAKWKAEATRGLLKRAEEKRDGLRVSYATVKSKRFLYDEGDPNCPACGQPIPEEAKKAARDKAEKLFLADKKNKLDEITRSGTDVSQEIETLNESIAEAAKELETAEQRVREAAERRDVANAKLQAYPAQPDYSINPRIAEVSALIAELQASVEQAPEDKVASLTERRVELQMQVDKKKELLARRDAGKETAKRIIALEQQQKDVGVALAELEQQIALAERFITDRCSVLEESINALFPTVRWKLFDRQINGGIVDVCQCMIPCESGLVAYESANTAAQIAADIEIVNVLSRHYDVYIPMFLDNAERINRIPPTDTQLITLSVSKDPELKIKKEDA